MAYWRTVLLTVIVLAVVATSEANRPNLFNKLGFTSGKKGGNSTVWAVLVAGSNGYNNYRHQADVCHAYQILKRGGLKDENIVVFMYDDIANSSENPRPGVIINHPNGSDVYAGVPKDYTGDSVTADNFLAVILGNARAVKGGSGKVIKSKQNDRIFVFYSDHGGPGVLGMPEGPNLYANDFVDALKKKHASGTYHEMVIYLESCESGSIFEGLLPNDLNIYVTTASNATQLSWATYCPGMNPPPPPEFHTCLGDLYSVSWMEDSESEDLKIETLEQQYLKVKERTYNKNSLTGSNVMEYGTQRISKETVSLFQGSSPRKSSTGRSEYIGSLGLVNQRDADLYSMWKRHKRSAKEPQLEAGLFKQINDIKAHRAHLDSSVDRITKHIFGPKRSKTVSGFVRSQELPLVDDWGCLKNTVRTFEKYCGSLTQYGMRHMRTFANICNKGVSLSAMEEASKATCSEYNMGQWDPSIVGYSA